MYLGGKPPTLEQYNSAARSMGKPEYGQAAPAQRPPTGVPDYATGYDPRSGWDMYPGQEPVYQGPTVPGVSDMLPTTPLGPEDVYNVGGGYEQAYLELQAQELVQQYELTRMQLEQALQLGQSQLAQQLQMHQEALAQELELVRMQLEQQMELGRRELGAGLLETLLDIQRDPFSIVPALQTYGAAGGGTMAPVQAFAETEGAGWPTPYGSLIEQLLGDLVAFAGGSRTAASEQAFGQAQEIAAASQGPEWSFLSPGTEDYPLPIESFPRLTERAGPSSWVR